MAADVIPPLPPGFTLDNDPPPPPGFTVDAAPVESDPVADPMTGHDVSKNVLPNMIRGAGNAVPFGKQAEAAARTLPIIGTGKPYSQNLSDVDAANASAMETPEGKLGNVAANTGIGLAAAPIGAASPVLTSAAYGGATALSDSRAPTISGKLADTAKGAAIGAGLASGAGLVGKAVESASPYIQAGVKKVADAAQARRLVRGAESIAEGAGKKVAAGVKAVSPGLQQELAESPSLLKATESRGQSKLTGEAERLLREGAAESDAIYEQAVAPDKAKAASAAEARDIARQAAKNAEDKAMGRGRYSDIKEALPGSGWDDEPAPHFMPQYRDQLNALVEATSGLPPGEERNAAIQKALEKWDGKRALPDRTAVDLPPKELGSGATDVASMPAAAPTDEAVTAAHKLPKTVNGRPKTTVDKLGATSEFDAAKTQVDAPGRDIALEPTQPAITAAGPKTQVLRPEGRTEVKPMPFPEPTQVTTTGNRYLSELDRRIKKLSTGNDSEVLASQALQRVRDRAEHLGGKEVDPRELRNHQSNHQLMSYGKAMAGDVEGNANLLAHAEASKAAGDAVLHKVLGMNYAEAQATAAADPNSLAAKLLRANQKISVANRILAATAAKEGKGTPSMLHEMATARHAGALGGAYMMGHYGGAPGKAIGGALIAHEVGKVALPHIAKAVDPLLARLSVQPVSPAIASTAAKMLKAGTQIASVNAIVHRMNQQAENAR